MGTCSRLPSAVLVASLLVLSACDSGGAKGSAPSTVVGTTPRGSIRVADNIPGHLDRVTFRGTLTLDGAPFDAKVLGAVVRRDGLVTPCQVTRPPVTHGRYEITVYAETESRGCGARGSEVLLWTFARGQTLYSSAAVAWPAVHAQNFATTFSTAAPNGAVPVLAQFNGDAFTPGGKRLPAGTRVEAYVGPTRCGIASTRRTSDYSGFILAVVGPDAVPGCTRGATLTLRVNGKPVAQTAVNTPSAHADELHLTVRASG